MERLNLTVEDGTGELLTKLADGDRKRGQWISDLIRAIDRHQAVGDGAEVETLRAAVIGLSAMLRTLEGRVLRLEGRQ